MTPFGQPRPLQVALIGGFAILGLVFVAHVPGAAVGLTYLAPAIFVFSLLWLGHYPGQRIFLALSRPARNRRRSVVAARFISAVVGVPRGSCLLASALASRARPLSSRPQRQASLSLARGRVSRPNR